MCFIHISVLTHLCKVGPVLFPLMHGKTKVGLLSYGCIVSKQVREKFPCRSFWFFQTSWFWCFLYSIASNNYMEVKASTWKRYNILAIVMNHLLCPLCCAEHQEIHMRSLGSGPRLPGAHPIHKHTCAHVCGVLTSASRCPARRFTSKLAAVTADSNLASFAPRPWHSFPSSLILIS